MTPRSDSATAPADRAIDRVASGTLGEKSVNRVEVAGPISGMTNVPNPGQALLEKT